MAKLDQPRYAIPLTLHRTDFYAAWSEWVSYRKARRLTITPLTMRRQLQFLELMGPERAIQAIEQSVQQGWAGLFEPRVQQNGVPVRVSGIEMTVRLKELERVEKQIDNLRLDGLSSLDEPDRIRLKALKARREELKGILGIMV
jgi:hypothetical protein